MRKQQTYVCPHCGEKAAVQVMASLKERTLRCQQCSKEHKRPHTKESKERFESLWKRKTPGQDIHRVWHNFWRKFKKDDSTYKLEGYELMCAVEKWAKKFPTHVTITRCDDKAYTSSALALIQHRATASHRYHGTTVVFIPQSQGSPCEFFLYKGHAEQLVKGLQGILSMKCVQREHP